MNIIEWSHKHKKNDDNDHEDDNDDDYADTVSLESPLTDVKINWINKEYFYYYYYYYYYSHSTCFITNKEN
jgi:hypothetical protein